MPPRKAKQTFKVIAIRKGKVAKTSRITLPLTIRSSTASPSSSALPGNDNVDFSEVEDIQVLPECQSTAAKKPRLKKKLRAYHTRKTRLAESWLKVRQQLLSAMLGRCSLPLGQICALPGCVEEATGRCLDCGPANYLCETHLSMAHAGGRTLRQPEVWKVICNFTSLEFLCP